MFFRGGDDPNKPMSEASVNQIIKRVGYGYGYGYAGKVTGHGFRHTFSTIRHDYDTTWIELQLAHVDKNSIRGTYNHAQYIIGRKRMMQWYSDFIFKV